VIGEVTDGIMQNFAQNVEQMLQGGQQPAAAASTVAGPTSATTAGGRVTEPTGQPAQAAAATVDDLDAWRLIIRPMLQRHAGSLTTVAFAGLAAYVGARAGSRPRR
jgi:hypothetical protein